ncbi:MAG: DUF6609 family protein [Coriobacteriia bacterium]
MEWLTGLPHAYPLMRGGAILFVLVGLGIVVGGIGGRRWMLPSLIAGAILSFLALATLSISGLIFAGLGRPSVAQWVAMGVGFAVEYALVSYVVYAIPDRDSRTFWLWMLIVVGAHFLVFTFSHGPLAGLLGLVCILNASIGLFFPRIHYRVLWVTDGLLKIGFGGWMLFLTYR